MVKIRYAELPAGLHVATEAGERCTIVYLKPGLTRAQRKDALMVARRAARFGHGPSLPAPDMAFALAADRTRTTARIMVSATRKHPLLLLPLLALVAGVVAAAIMAAAAIPGPPVSSAQPGGLSEFNIGNLVNLAPGSSPGSSGGAPHSGRSGTPGGAAGVRPAQPAAHGASGRHGRARGHHPDAGQQSASAR